MSSGFAVHMKWGMIGAATIYGIGLFDAMHYGEQTFYSYGIMGTACLVGAYCLNPDLDLQSIPLRNWGPLQIIWWPYRDCIKHRKIWSHLPILSTLIRCIYLLGFVILGFTLVGHWHTYLDLQAHLIQYRHNELWLCFWGLAYNDTLHWWKDGFPIKL